MTQLILLRRYNHENSSGLPISEHVLFSNLMTGSLYVKSATYVYNDLVLYAFIIIIVGHGMRFIPERNMKAIDLSSW